jgi:uncharacterized membrane protein YhhN
MSSIIIFFVRNPTTPPLWLELLITFILAILWLAVGLRVVTLHLNNWPCSIYKQCTSVLGCVAQRPACRLLTWVCG